MKNETCEDITNLQVPLKRNENYKFFRRYWQGNGLHYFTFKKSNLVFQEIIERERGSKDRGWICVWAKPVQMEVWTSGFIV